MSRVNRVTVRILLVALLVAGLSVAPIQGPRVAFADTLETVVEVVEDLPVSSDDQPSPPETGDDDGESDRDGEQPATSSDDSSSAASDADSDAAATDDADSPVQDAQGQTTEPVETPIRFSMIGFEAPRSGDIQFRTSADGENWEPWQGAPFLEADDGPDGEELRAAGDPTRFTEPIWVGEAAFVQVNSTELKVEDIKVHVIDSMGLSLTLPERAISFAKYLLQPPQPAAAEATSRPSIVTRSQWGANESLRRGNPSYNDDVRFAVVHHTAGSNSYTQAQAPGVVRGIYSYHTQTQGWNDIGYNFLIDKFGTIYEGRYGGMERGVIGAHARDFNSGSFGVSIMGNYDVAKPSSASIRAMENVLAWKMDTHLIDPNMVPARSGVNNAIVGHRDVGSTACPGRYITELMPSIRRNVAAKGGFSLANATPLTGDWNGDGRDTAGWFYNGRWWLRNSHASGPPDLVLTYGRKGDVPVVGDWNGDGRDTVGVVRDGNRWILRRTYVSGDDVVMTYGRKGDVPVTGDWNGDGRDTIGVVRNGNRWILRYEYRSGADIVMTYGRSGDKPVTGDFNGDGRDTLGVVRDNRFILRYEYRSGADIVLNYGRATDRPVTGDWNGDGTDTLGVVRDGRWILRYIYMSGADYAYNY